MPRNRANQTIRPRENMIYYSQIVACYYVSGYIVKYIFLLFPVWQHLPSSYDGDPILIGIINQSNHTVNIHFFHDIAPVIIDG